MFWKIISSQIFAIIKVISSRPTRLLTQNIHSDLTKNPQSLPTRLLIPLDFCMVRYSSIDIIDMILCRCYILPYIVTIVEDSTTLAPKLIGDPEMNFVEFPPMHGVA